MRATCRDNVVVWGVVRLLVTECHAMRMCNMVESWLGTSNAKEVNMYHQSSIVRLFWICLPCLVPSQQGRHHHTWLGPATVSNSVRPPNPLPLLNVSQCIFCSRTPQSFHLHGVTFQRIARTALPSIWACRHTRRGRCHPRRAAASSWPLGVFALRKRPGRIRGKDVPSADASRGAHSTTTREQVHALDLGLCATIHSLHALTAPSASHHVQV